MSAPTKASAEVLAHMQSIAQVKIQELKRPVRIAVAGPQGSGKSTLCEAWAKADPRVALFSLDDVYHTTAARKEIAAKHGAMLKTRGPPGTHDLALAQRVMTQLSAARSRDLTPLPRFDKLADAPVKALNWPSYQGTANIILVDGWCMGALPQAAPALSVAINDLEEKDDSTGKSRAFINAQLEGPYETFFKKFDLIVYFEAPSFDIVPRWRLEQEAGLRGVTIDTLPPEVSANIKRFVQHFERITRHMLGGGRRSEWTIALDEDRTPMEIRKGL
jgi:D-glycerate 3-kinase